MRTSKKVSVILPRLLLFFLVLSLSFNIIFAIREWRRDTVVFVTDGDTFSLADGRRVRLLGVDAPEMGRCMSAEAQSRLEALTLRRTVRLKDVTHDVYGRILASVLVDAPFDKWMEYLYFRFIKRAPYKNLVMINRVMVEEGLGLYHNSGGQYTKVLSTASRVARTGKLGIYSQDCLLEVPQNALCTIKGNVRNGKKTYFFPSCSNYKDVDVSLSFGDEWFCSEKDAQTTGFTKSATCR